jgi:RimJ/RimL family protein N-acetyltransferase
MRLIDVYSTPEAVDILWALLLEREPHQSISHRAMPTPDQHIAFIESKPYPHWYLIDCGDYVGATYLTHQREIGIGVLKKYQKNGYGSNAVQMLMDKHPGKFLANVNPRNLASIHMFMNLGAIHRQNTYSLGDA